MATIDPSHWFDMIREDRRVLFEGDHRRIEQWTKALDLYRFGSQFTGALQSQMRINVTQGVVDNMTAFLMPDEIRAAVYPVATGQEERAERVQALLNNHVLPMARFEEHAENALQEANIFSDSFLKIGYIGDARRSAADEGTEQMLETTPGAPVQAGGDFGERYTQEFISDSVWFSVVKPWNLWGAPGVTRLDDSPYVVHKIRKRIEDVRNNPNYPNGGEVRPGVDDEFERRSDMPQIERPLSDFIDLYEVWHLRDQWFGVLAHGNTNMWVREPGDWPFPGLAEYPFAHLGFQRDPRGLYRIPLLGHIASLQEELNQISTYMIEAFKRSVPVIAYNKNVVGEKTLERLASGELLEMIEIDSPDIRNAMQLFPQGNTFSPDIYGIRNMIVQAMLLVTGQADFVIGQAQRSKSATEAGLQAQSFRGRLQRREKTFHRFLADAVRKAYRIIRARMTREKWVRAVGISGASAIQVGPRDLAEDDLMVHIDVESAEDRDRDPVRLRIVTDAMAPLVQNPQALAIAGVDPIELFRRYLKAVGLRNIDKLQPVGARPNDPEDENLAMAQGQRVEIHPLDDDATHIRSHEAARVAAQDSVQQVFREHLAKHQQALLLKIQASSQGGQGGLVGGLEGIIQEPESTGAAGGEEARVQQAGANR